jgi:hypothetical protein
VKRGPSRDQRTRTVCTAHRLGNAVRAVQNAFSRIQLNLTRVERADYGQRLTVNHSQPSTRFACASCTRLVTAYWAHTRFAIVLVVGFRPLTWDERCLSPTSATDELSRVPACLLPPELQAHACSTLAASWTSLDTGTRGTGR